MIKMIFHYYKDVTGKLVEGYQPSLGNAIKKSLQMVETFPIS